jgi:subtilase family protein
VDCFQPGQICVFPSPEGEPGQLADRLESGDLPGDVEGVESTFNDVLRANLPAVEVSQSTSYRDFVDRASSMPMRDFAVLRVPEGRELESAGQLLKLAEVGYSSPNYYIAAAGGREETIEELRQLAAAVPRAPSPDCARGVLVAVVDSGVDEEALAEATGQPGWRLDSSFDAFASPGRPMREGDDSGHGTAVATIINMTAPGARLIAVRVLNNSTGTLSSLVNGLLIAACVPGLTLINMSVSGTPGRCGDCGRVAETGVELALGRLLSATFHGDPPLVLAAAGNREGIRPLAFPASSGEVVAVGSYEATTSGTVYTSLDPDRFFLAHDFRATAKRFQGTSYACALTTGYAARYARAFRNRRCGSWPQPPTPGPLRPFLQQRLADTADRNYPTYDKAQHGQGLARLQ